ncbi:molybdopterin molybdotransferase MoeA [bacterium]|nr:molybdopterin molybdotransferase MoeA [bacterium]
MLTYEQALKAILDNCQPLSRETISLGNSLRRVIAEPIKANFDLPQFNNSAVDGFGVLVEDLIGASPTNPATLTIIGEVSAGANPSLGNSSARLNPGQCIRILTGAPVPADVEAIVMKEVCQTQEPLQKKENDQKQASQPETIAVSTSTRIGENIRLQGEEIEAGATVLQPGTRISPPVLGLIATLGVSELSVYRTPRVAVISTGDELIEPGLPIAEGQIYNSNSYALVAALNALGVTEVQRFHAKDNRAETSKVLQEALDFADIVISAGGVSVGEYDFIKEVCEEQGVETIFWRIAIKPGKPVYFGVNRSAKAGQLVFGLPGNPVSALVTFNLFVRPAIARMQAASTTNRHFQAKAARHLKKKAGRLDFVRGKLSLDNSIEISAMPTVGQESHMLTGLAKADCLMHFARELEFLPEGEYIKVELLNWFE